MFEEKELMDNEVINYAVVPFMNNPDKEKQNEKMKTYYEKLRNNVDHALDHVNIPTNIRKIILSAPDLFYLVWKLTFTSEVKGKHKKKLAYSLLYFISPIDFVPDFIPAVGHLDDVIVVCYALNSVLNEVDEKYIQEYWLGDEKLLDFVRMTLKEIDNLREFVIEYIRTPLTNSMRSKNKNSSKFD